MLGGFRNAYDIAFNAHGELFTYDSDMEWDRGLPWYRPTRILHVVPGGFVRIRHFGFLANRTRRAKLARCRALLHQPPAPAPAAIESAPALMLRLTGIDIERCPLCHQGRLHVTEFLAPTPLATPRVPLLDTS